MTIDYFLSVRCDVRQLVGGEYGEGSVREVHSQPSPVQPIGVDNLQVLTEWQSSDPFRSWM
jgi:hypothetical protein